MPPRIAYFWNISILISSYCSLGFFETTTTFVCSALILMGLPNFVEMTLQGLVYEPRVFILRGYKGVTFYILPLAGRPVF